jgi:hypothetical protein
VTQGENTRGRSWSVWEQGSHARRVRPASDQTMHAALDPGKQERGSLDRRSRDGEPRGPHALRAPVLRRSLVPALWGAVIVGGVLVTGALVRNVLTRNARRREALAPALLRVTIEPAVRAKGIWSSMGEVVARFAVQHLLSSPALAKLGVQVPRFSASPAAVFGSTPGRES